MAAPTPDPIGLAAAALLTLLYLASVGPLSLVGIAVALVQRGRGWTGLVNAGCAAVVCAGSTVIDALVVTTTVGAWRDPMIVGAALGTALASGAWVAVAWRARAGA
jgi:hypothetical protein